jgi:hypothetical protein
LLERFGKFEKMIVMLAAEEKRENIIKQVSALNEEQLDLVNELLKKIDLLKKDSIEYLFAEATAQYGNTLKRLAE